MKLARWREFPAPIRQHLQERVKSRQLTERDLAKLLQWVASSPDVPEKPWYKDFETFKICGEGRFPKTFLTEDMDPRGECL